MCSTTLLLSACIDEKSPAPLTLVTPQADKELKNEKTADTGVEIMRTQVDIAAADSVRRAADSSRIEQDAVTDSARQATKALRAEQEAAAARLKELEQHKTQETLLPGQVKLRRRRGLEPVRIDVPPVQKEGDTVKVAVLLPLSGEHSSLAETLFNAAELALFQSGVTSIELLPRDTRGTTDGAATAAQSALASGAQLIIGPVFADSVAAVAPIARLGRVKVLSFTTDKRVVGDGVFAIGFTPEEQVDRILQYATSQGLTNLAALVPDTPYGNKVLNTVNLAGSKYGAQMMDIVQYPPDAESLSERMKLSIQDIAQYAARRESWKIRKKELEQQLAADPENPVLEKALEILLRRDTLGKLNYQALVLPESGARLRVVASFLPHYDIDPGDVRLLGTGLWADPSLGREPALNGGWFAGPSLTTDRSFHKTYKRAYGEYPPMIASLAYDAVALSAVLAPKGIPDYSMAALTNPNGFVGSQGVFRLLSSGVSQHSLAILELTPDGLKEVDPAPTSFSSVVN